MSIFSDNPVLARELRGRLRFKRLGPGRRGLWVVGPLGAVGAYFYIRALLGLWRGTAQDAREFWPLLVYGALFLIVLLAPALAATAITQEREQQTWETLTATRLSASDVIGGKWLGRQVIPCLLLVILIPFMVVCTARASLGALLVPSTVGFLLVTSGFYGAMGLLCSFGAKRTAAATALALTLTALLCVGTVIINRVVSYLTPGGFNGSPGRSGSAQDSPVMWLNPFNALGLLLAHFSADGTNFGAPDSEIYGQLVLVYFIVTLTATAAALGFMVCRYGRATQG